jgi:Zn finger protein HypA/HybF involved in hydrogenase expression
MYYCKNCHKEFDKLLQLPKDDKMFQLCPHCKSENVDLRSNLSDSQKMRILQEHKLERILDEKNNILMSRKECSKKEI